MYDRELIDNVLKAADIADVVRHYLPDSFQKKGKGFAARCPFHDDHDPSLSINEEKQIYHCFVCGHGGNAIRFVQEFTKCSFPEAVRKTAEIAGYHDPRLDKEIPLASVDPAKKRLLDCIAELEDFYRYSLTTPEGETARDYLAKRNLEPETQARFGIGYAPREGSTAIRFLRAKGYSPKNIEDIGISNVGDSIMKDTNAGRITFPIWDKNGNVIGFSARQIIRDPSTGKYRNSPETPLFHKSEVLYNFHNVVQSAHRDGYCYVLEGFMDVIALTKAGIPNAIALMGTALTKQQIALLRSLRCEIRLCLDGDAAGQGGMMNALQELSSSGMSVRVVNYGSDLRDPDDILQEDGAEALKARMGNLLDPMDFQLSYYKENKKLERPEDKRALISRLGPLIMAESDLERETHIARLAEALGYDVNALRMVLYRESSAANGNELQTLRYQKSAPSHPKKLTRRTRLGTAEEAILYYLLTEQRAREDVAKLDENPFLTKSYRQILFYLLQYASDCPPGEFAIPGLLGFMEGNEDSSETGSLSEIVASVASEKRSLPYSPSLLSDCLQAIQEEKKKMIQRKAVDKAVESGDQKLAASALKAYAQKRVEEWQDTTKKD